MPEKSYTYVHSTRQIATWLLNMYVEGGIEAFLLAQAGAHKQNASDDDERMSDSTMKRSRLALALVNVMG